MDILNFISWIKSKRVTSSIPEESLLPIGILDSNRGDSYLTYATTVKDLAFKVRDLNCQNQILETTLFAFPLNYVIVPIMEEDCDTITGPSFLFGNINNLKSYTVSGTISVQTNNNLWYIGTLSADVTLNGTFPWKVAGAVYAYDDSLPGGMWLQTGLSDGARFSDTAGGSATADYCTVIEDYNGTPGSIDLYLAASSSTAVGDIYGNAAFQYKFYVDKSINLVFTN